METLPIELKTATNRVTLDSITSRDLSKKLFDSTVLDHRGISGGNNSEIPLVCQIKGCDFLIPEYCR